MDTLLQAIQAKIAETVTAIKYVDENWGQLDLYGNEIPVQWPCALISLSSAVFSNLATDFRAVPVNRQEGTATVEVTFAKLKLSNSSYKAPAAQKAKAWEIWDIVNDAHKVLHGWNPVSGTGKLIRTGISQVRRDDGVQEIRVVYTIGLHNC
ncbi:hypothetical protein [Chryseobacterium sp.]|uniref:hypothetical protein n=1 Tax=Chryseobacterium sp. TaxID=1871047 RepID=UPI001E42F846|nr:hypothetical protein [Chryseobacterium sp.]